MSNESTTILLADDEADFLDILSGYLKRKHEVITAENGHIAWEALQNRGDIEVVLTDYEMPIMDGRQLLQNTYQHYPNIGRIINSGRFAEADIRKEVETSCHPHFMLTKPVNFQAINAAIEETLSIIRGEKAE